MVAAGVAALSSVALAGSASAACAPEHAWAPPRQDFARQVVDLVNAHRAGRGLQPLAISRALTRSALWKSRHMAHYGYVEHDDPAPPVQRTVSERARACGYPGDAGENIAAGQRTPEAVMADWLSSSGHRANIEDPDYRVIGVGTALGGPHWTQNFGFVNDAGNSPPAARADSARAVEDVTAPLRIGVLGNDVDEDPDWLYISAVGRPANGRVVATDHARALTYVPNRDFAGVDRFSYVVTDLVGETAQGFVSVNVANVNDRPRAVNDFFVVPRGRRAILAVTRNDRDIDRDRLVVTRIVRAPRRGRARALRGGRIDYSPARGFSGRDSLVYRVSDGRGGTADATVTVRVR